MSPSPHTLESRSSHLSHPTRRLSVCIACGKTGLVDRATRKCAMPSGYENGMEKWDPGLDPYADKFPAAKGVAKCLRVQKRIREREEETRLFDGIVLRAVEKYEAGELVNA